MRYRFDQIGKQIGKKALGASGQTVAHDEIAPDAQYADLRHEPDPARAEVRARMGLLGRMASVPCLIELYGHAPDAAELRACLGKHFVAWRQRERRGREGRRGGRWRGKRGRARNVEPFLWIVAAGTPTTLLAELRMVPAPDWPRGVYLFGGDVLRVGLVAANELPRERSTLLVRLMAAGPLLPDAVADMAALPRGARERIAAREILLRFRHAIAQKPRHTPKEKELMGAMDWSWEQAEDLGLARGRAEGQANALLTVLRHRGIRVPIATREQIRAERSLKRLERWIERSVTATTITEVLAGTRRSRRPPAAPPRRATAHRRRSPRRAAAAPSAGR